MIKEKNVKIQILRAIAIIGVVLIHTCPSGKWQIFVRPFINFAVPIFIFLSGYLTKIDTTDWKTFYKKRIIRVLIPYFIWTILYTTADSIGSGLDFKKYIVNLLTTKAATSLYYIFVYIQLVILTPFLCKLAKSKYKWTGLLIGPIGAIIKYVLFLSGIESNKYVASLWYVCCLGWITYYYLGLLLGNKIINKKIRINKLVIFYTFSIIIQMIEGYIWYRFEEPKCGTQIKLSTILTSSIFILMSYWYLNNKNFKFTNKVLVKIGDYSFGIYLSHLMILRILQKIPFYSHIPFVLNSFILLTLTIICVFIGNKICGKKISKWLGLN